MVTSTAEIAKQILGEHSISVLDIGARWGADDSWWRMKGLAELIGFEPDPSECARLNSSAAAGERYLPVALADVSGERTLHVAKHPACSSLYPPIESLLDRYPVLDMMQQVDTCKVSVATLDELQKEGKIGPASFVKLDTQGAELVILKGAGETLGQCCGVEAELMFAPLYQEQPLFSAVAEYLADKGFYPWRMNDPCLHAEGSPIPNDPSGRLFWANFVFLRDYRELEVDASTFCMHLTLASLYHAIGDIRAALGCVSHSLDAPGLALSEGTRGILENHQACLTYAIEPSGGLHGAAFSAA